MTSIIWSVHYHYDFEIVGGHINPAVSTMFWSLGKLTTIRLVFYILAQTAGAFIGAALVYMTYFGEFLGRVHSDKK